MKNDEQPVEYWSSWKHLVSISERLSNQAESGTANIREICQYLESIEISLGKGIDPIKNIQEYSLRQFCRSLRRTLNTLE